MEKCGFFDATETNGVYDNVYFETDFAKYFSSFIKSGVHIDPANQLQVSAKTGLIVTVKPGRAFIDGYWYELDNNKDFTFPLNETANTKLYYIVCKLDRTAGNVTTTYREIGEDVGPINNGNIHELILASVSLGVGVSVITNSIITDTRPDNSYCGYVRGIGDDIDTTGIFQQFQSAFNLWFQNVKDTLSEDAAGNLLQKIEKVELETEQKIAEVEGSLSEVATTGEYGDLSGTPSIPEVVNSLGVGSNRNVYSALFIKNSVEKRLIREFVCSSKTDLKTNTLGVNYGMYTDSLNIPFPVGQDDEEIIIPVGINFRGENASLISVFGMITNVAIFGTGSSRVLKVNYACVNISSNSVNLRMVIVSYVKLIMSGLGG